MDLSDTFSISDNVVAREVGGEMVLLDLASGQYFGLDKVGSRIWELVSQSPRALGELCDKIEAEFDAPRARIEADLIELVEQLLQQDLITRAAN